MSEFRRVTDDFWVSPQISVQDVAAARGAGFRLIINNRPDDEAPDQPLGAEIEAAARAEGLDYLFVPVVGRPRSDQVDAVRAAVDAAGGKTLAFCRSGTRSIFTWAMGRVDRDHHDDLIAVGEAAGYDLRPAIGAP